MMEDFLGWVNIILMNIVSAVWILFGIIAGLTIVAMVLDVFVGFPKLTTKTSKKSTANKSSGEYDWNAADEAQRRFMADNSRAYEESVRLHDMAVREAWDAYTTACDQHQTAVDMHNDFSCGGWDPWL